MPLELSKEMSVLESEYARKPENRAASVAALTVIVSATRAEDTTVS